jgi:DNA-3-methyladenine glycosylase
MKKLPHSFYARKDVVQIARELVGKILVTRFNGVTTSGRIVETEAYVARIDKASHAFGGRRTARNEHMYGAPGTAYVYICYGMHRMFNVVTNEKEIPDAILIRAVEPMEGIDVMLERTSKPKADYTITKGPGNVGKALGIDKHHSGTHLSQEEIFIAQDDFRLEEDRVGVSARIGVESAGADALLPYRFYVRGNKYVSRGNK